MGCCKDPRENISTEPEVILQSRKIRKKERRNLCRIWKPKN